MITDEIKDLKGEGRVLGLDVGGRYIGLAISDFLGSIASPLEVVEYSKLSIFISQINDIIKENEAVSMVVGYPLEMDGSVGSRAQSVKQLANNLSKEIDLPIYLQDERLSTAVVNNAMLEADLSRQKRKKNKDALAATYILQSALDIINATS